MTDRLGLLLPSEMSDAQREQHNAFTQYTKAKYDGIFKTHDDLGRLTGPFGILLHTPEVAATYRGMSTAIAKSSSLDAGVRETAILVVGSRTGAKYETYAHEPVSGFSEAECTDIKSGRCPDSFDAKKRVAFAVADALTSKPGPLDEELWKGALEELGRDQAVSLVHYIGLYSYVAVLLNGFDASIPQ